MKKRLFALTSVFFALALAFPALAQEIGVAGSTINNIAGIPLSSVIIAVRFAAALWAAVGLAYFTWGMVDYLLSHGNEHHKHEAQGKIAEGFVILFTFTLVWGIFKIIVHYIFG